MTVRISFAGTDTERGRAPLFAYPWSPSTRSIVSALAVSGIVTVPANPLMAEIHDAGKNRHRMPPILGENGRAAWIEGDEDDASAVIDPCPADEMAARAVGRALDNPGLDDPTVLEG